MSQFGGQFVEVINYNCLSADKMRSDERQQEGRCVMEGGNRISCRREPN